MARNRAFDTGVVVQAARDVFWTLGYDAAAMPDLERATGLARSSLYNAFGSKRGLFDAAVQSYLGEVVRPRLAALAAASTGAAGLRAYFESVAAAVLAGVEGAGPGGTPAGPPGCLLLVAASGSRGRDGKVRAAVDAYRQEVTGAFAAALRRDIPAWGGGGSPRDDGAPGEEQDAWAGRRARLLFAVLAAGMTLARINAEEAAATLRSAGDLADAAAIR